MTLDVYVCVGHESGKGAICYIHLIFTKSFFFLNLNLPFRLSLLILSIHQSLPLHSRSPSAFKFTATRSAPRGQYTSKRNPPFPNAAVGARSQQTRRQYSATSTMETRWCSWAGATPIIGIPCQRNCPWFRHCSCILSIRRLTFSITRLCGNETTPAFSEQRKVENIETVSRGHRLIDYEHSFWYGNHKYCIPVFFYIAISNIYHLSSALSPIFPYTSYSHQCISSI